MNQALNRLWMLIPAVTAGLVVAVLLLFPRVTAAQAWTVKPNDTVAGLALAGNAQESLAITWNAPNPAPADDWVMWVGSNEEGRAWRAANRNTFLTGNSYIVAGQDPKVGNNARARWVEQSP